MKCTTLLITVLTLLVFSTSLNAQVKNVEKEAERQGTKRINRKIDKGIDKGFDKIEEGIGSLFGKKKKKNNKQSQEEQVQQNNHVQQNDNQPAKTEQTPKQPNVQWSRFDFVPGDEVIFEDAPSKDEENGEFPSRWDLVEGNCEIIEVDGEKVIAFPKGGMIVPYLKYSKDDYLPEVFTIEFDAWLWHDNQRDIYVKWYDKKNQKANGLYDDLEVNSYSLEAGDTYQELERKTEHNGKWRHISIAYTRGKLKAYLDDTRLINIPHYEGNPSGITIQCHGYSGDKPEQLQYIKNIRIAKGGVKYYDRILSDGKIIVNGIRFDVNKSTIKPESNGAINEIFQLMQKQPELNFSVEGHTDSDGDEARNQTLSEERAKAVMDRLISMGISASRLKSTGWGESKPLGENGTAEGKANNRRVEFVKFTGSAAPSNNSSSSSPFDNLDAKTIEAKIKELPQVFSIQISNPTGILYGEGTIILYATSQGNIGKMEILNIDKNDNYKLTAKYITYSPNGAVLSQSNHIEVKGTYRCDLDKANTEDVSDADEDFQWGRQDETTTVMWPGQNEKSQIRVFQ